MAKQVISDYDLVNIELAICSISRVIVRLNDINPIEYKNGISTEELESAVNTLRLLVKNC